jgi:regulator of cell morphogenesis and NO signaling
MYQAKKIFITQDMLMSDIISGNPYLMFMLEHFGIDLVVHEQTVAQLCGKNGISLELFLSFANLFNGFSPTASANYTFADLKTITLYLRNSHQYYLNEKYPQIRRYIAQIYEINEQASMLMVEKFFDEYFKEVTEHLFYEDQVAFSYINSLFTQLENKQPPQNNGDYSVKDYREHHDDIEEKLEDLKNLLLKHLPQQDDQLIRRKLLLSLFELEYDLSIHTRIEEAILIPLVEKLEQFVKNNND